jgi:hypothetical protein
VQSGAARLIDAVADSPELAGAVSVRRNRNHDEDGIEIFFNRRVGDSLVPVRTFWRSKTHTRPTSSAKLEDTSAEAKDDNEIEASRNCLYMPILLLLCASGTAAIPESSPPQFPQVRCSPKNSAANRITRATLNLSIGATREAGPT